MAKTSKSKKSSREEYSHSGNDGRSAYEKLEMEMEKTGRSITRTKRRVKRHVKQKIEEKLIKECEDISYKMESILPNDL